MSINILQIPDAPGGYSVVGKKIMAHDQSAPLGSSTVLIPLTSFNTGYAAPIWTVDGLAGSPVAGQLTFIDASLIGATQMNYIIVNKVIEFIDDDYTFDDVLGKITRLNAWVNGDRMITPFKPA